MKVSKRGLLEIASHEGVVPGPYLDSVGVWTCYIGHTTGAGAPNPAAMKRGMPDDLTAELWKVFDLFSRDVVKYADRVNAAINVPLKQYEFDALVSFDYNTGGIHRATLTKRINAKDPLAYESFMGWVKPPEIKKRRTAEMNLFRTGDYDANGMQIPIWKVDVNGKLRGHHSTISGHNALAMIGAGGDPTHVHIQTPQSAPETPRPIDLPDHEWPEVTPPAGILAALIAAILKMLGVRK